MQERYFDGHNVGTIGHNRISLTRAGRQQGGVRAASACNRRGFRRDQGGS